MILTPRSTTPLAALIALALSTSAWAYESGSTGADGALNPTVNTTIQLPPNGVLNYTNINIPAGVLVTFQKNTTNTPVVILVGGDATIAGSIDVSGGAAAAAGAAGDGNIGDDGNPGLGGPGAFGGGQGGKASATVSERVSQPGAGAGGASEALYHSGNWACGGSGAGFASAGKHGGNGYCGTLTTPGAAYGDPGLLPLVGGSGGGGGGGGTAFRGGGGGGGGGALLLAVSGTLSVTGSLRADGGAGGTVAGAGVGGAGGGGSGGAIRLVATELTGNGAATAIGGVGPRVFAEYSFGGEGSPGRIRFEAETYTRTAASNPAYSFGTPGPVFVAGLPALRISKVAGVDAPVSPTGNADIALPEDTVNPVAVEVATTGVPLGNTVTITLTPAFGPISTHITNALAGTEDAATATASVPLPAGPSSLLATVSYSVPEAVAMQSPYRELSGDDDLIERIALEALPDGTLRRIATTRSGREIDLSTVVALGG